MNISKRFDRMRQWTDERLGKEVKTNTTDEFKALETEMGLRSDGMEKLQRSMNTYVKSMSKVKEAEDKEKTLPIANMGASMVAHGEDFEPDSQFGQCLTNFGRANERIARLQETYVAKATTTWLESVERSVAQMKEYHAARKKLESRRLAFDTSQAKMQKSRKDDFRMEEELRAQRAKYDESSDDVYRRMLDIKEAEADSVADLGAFLDAELSYYERAREVLLQLKQDWPAGDATPVSRSRITRSRSNTTSSYLTDDDEDRRSTTAGTPTRPTISSRVPSAQNSPRRPTFERAETDTASISSAMSRLSATPGQDLARTAKLRRVMTNASDTSDSDGYETRSASFSGPSQAAGAAVMAAGLANKRAPPPPPPPSRTKKPPPPPPMKRNAVSTSEVPHY